MILKFNSGLGDTIQAIPVVKELLKKNKDIKVVTRYKTLWDGICETVPFKSGVQHDKRISYISRRPIQDTTQFQDVCIEAGVSKNIPFKLDWTVKNKKLVKEIKNDAFFSGKDKICLYDPIRMPCDQKDNIRPMFYDLMPREGIIKEIVAHFKGVHFVNIRDLNTSVLDLIDICKSVDILLSQIGHFVCVGEALDTKAFIVYSAKGRDGEYDFVKYLTPKKIKNKETTVGVYDDVPMKEIFKQFKELLYGTV